MKKLILLLCVLFNLITASAQFGVSGGTSFLKAFGIPKPYIGFHVGVEIPRDDQMSFYGRATFYLKQNLTGTNQAIVQAVDPTNPMQFELINYNQSFNYTVLEGGNRYYLGDGYDSGFGAYGGGKVAIIFNSVKRKYDWGNISEADYSLPSTELPRGSVFNVGFGLQGGVKHTFAGLGTLYLDADFVYLIMGYPSNSTAQTGASDMWTPLLFSVNLGFRKDIY